MLYISRVTLLKPSPIPLYMYYFVQLNTGLIVRSKDSIKFDEKGWSDAATVGIKFPNYSGERATSDPSSYGFYTTENFSFKRESAVAYWSEQ